MLIQNIDSVAQAPQPGGFTSNGAPSVVVAAPLNTGTPPAPQQPSPAQLKNAVDSLNEAMRQSNSSLKFSLDPGTKEAVVQMVDTGTGQLISQYPSKQVLAIAQAIDQFQQRQGLLLNQKA